MEKPLKILIEILRPFFQRKARGKCPFCSKTVFPEIEFRDELSRKEFRISGLCQDCQDEVFKRP